MKQIFTVFVFQLIFQSLYSQSCGVDNDENLSEIQIPQQIYNPQPAHNNDGLRRLNSQEYEPIRITFDYTGLSEVSQIVQDRIKLQLEIARQYFSKILKVKRIQGNNIFGGFVWPPPTEPDTGIPNSDLHIKTFTVNATRGFVASAGTSYQQDSDRRPTHGSINFNVHHYSEQGLQDNWDFQSLLKTTIHEITHILAFNTQLFDDFRDKETQQPYEKVHEMHTYQDRTNAYIVTPKVKQMAQEYFGCNSVPGMPTEGSRGPSSHWEKNAMANDYMLSASVHHDPIFSKFTLALFEDSGWYEVSYDINDPSFWGKGKGCGFLETCDGAQFPEYKENYGYTCNYLGTGADVYNEQYNSVYAGSCKMGRTLSNWICIKESNKDLSYMQETQQSGASVFSPNSKCFKSTVWSTTAKTSYGLRCYEFECQNNAQQLFVKIAGEQYEVNKTTNEAEITIKGNNTEFIGSVQGPEEWDSFCDKHSIPCKNYCSQNGVCVNNECICHKDKAGEDCSVVCADDQYADSEGNCLQSQQCPGNTLKFHPNTKWCETCPPNQLLHQNTCVSQCPNGFYPDNGKCSQCLQECSQCDNGASCTECKPDKYKLINRSNRTLFTCESQCPEKQYPDSQNTCQPCENSCQSCSDGDSCSECPQNYSQDSNNLCTIFNDPGNNNSTDSGSNNNSTNTTDPGSNNNQTNSTDPGSNNNSTNTTDPGSNNNSTDPGSNNNSTNITDPGSNNNQTNSTDPGSINNPSDSTGDTNTTQPITNPQTNTTNSQSNSTSNHSNNTQLNETDTNIQPVDSKNRKEKINDTPSIANVLNTPFIVAISFILLITGLV